MLSTWILALAIFSGQLIRIPTGTHGAVNLLDITVIILCSLGLYKLKLHLKKPPLFIITAICFILVALLSLFLTPLNLTDPEYLTSLFYIVRFSLYIILGWLILSGAFVYLRQNTPQVLVFSGIGLAILGLLQFIFFPDLTFLTSFGWDPHYFRTVSTFLDPNFLGSYLVLTLILLVVHPKGVLNRHLGIVCVVLVYLALLTTFSRGAYLAFLTSFGSLSILNRSIKLGLITILLFSGLLLGFTAYQKLVAQPRGVDRAQSAEFRFSTWQQGWQIFQSHPILGVGFNAYRYALKEYNLGPEQFISSHGASSNDSSLLYVAATTGVIGIICYLFLLFTLLKEALRKNLILVAGLSGLIIHSFFANSLFYPPILLWIILTATVPKR